MQNYDHNTRKEIVNVTHRGDASIVSRKDLSSPGCFCVRSECLCNSKYVFNLKLCPNENHSSYSITSAIHVT